MISLDDIVKRSTRTAWRVIDGSAFIIIGDKNILHRLNSVGTRIWELCDGSRSLREISFLLLDEFMVERDEVEKDLMEFISSLRREGLIEFRRD